MKTRTLLRIAGSIFASGLFSTAVLAGPGPQYWNRAAKPAAKPEAAGRDSQSSDKCDGCKTTQIWAVHNRGPAEKGVPGARIVGQKHSCTRCAGVIATANGKTATDMTHDPRCATLLCCQ